MEKTEAGLKGLYIRKIVTKILIHKILHYSTMVSVCFKRILSAFNKILTVFIFPIVPGRTAENILGM